MTDVDHAAEASFLPLRPKLVRVAYRMLGSVADAEDIAQEAFLRWMHTDRSVILVPEAFLRRTVMRLCLDQLKSARHRRETYIGPWLPEPFVEEEEHEDVSLPLMLALERLSPLERAVFLLHDVFEHGFEEVAEIVERTPAACRQLAVRARTHVRAARPRFQVQRERARAIVQAFFDATRSGDLKTLATLLASDVALHADGGGKRPAAMALVQGSDAVMALHAMLAPQVRLHPSRWMRPAFINGLPGFVTLEADGMLQTTALDIVDGQIAAIYVVRNPDKLQHLPFAYQSLQ